MIRSARRTSIRLAGRIASREWRAPRHDEPSAVRARGKRTPPEESRHSLEDREPAIRAPRRWKLSPPVVFDAELQLLAYAVALDDDAGDRARRAMPHRVRQSFGEEKAKSSSYRQRHLEVGRPLDCCAERRRSVFPRERPVRPVESCTKLRVLSGLTEDTLERRERFSCLRGVDNRIVRGRFAIPVIEQPAGYVNAAFEVFGQPGGERGLRIAGCGGHAPLQHLHERVEAV